MTALYNVGIGVVVTVHIAWIAIMLAGAGASLLGLLRRRPVLEAGYLVAIALTALNRVVSPDVCWLTQAELVLRQLAGQPITRLGFIERGFAALGLSVSSSFIMTAETAWFMIGIGATLAWHLGSLIQRNKRRGSIGAEEA